MAAPLEKSIKECGEANRILLIGRYIVDPSARNCVLTERPLDMAWSPTGSAGHHIVLMDQEDFKQKIIGAPLNKPSISAIWLPFW